MGLHVELPMTVEMDNSGARDLTNSSSIDGRTRHIDMQKFFMRELREEGMIVFKHILGQANEADIFVKNVDGFLESLRNSKP